MQLEVKVTASVTVKVEGRTCQEAFDRLGEAQEIFGQNECGVCKKGGARLQIKRPKGHVFYQAKCVNAECGAELTFVAMQNGHMFPSRTNKDKTLKPNGGWEIYKGRSGDQAREPQDYSQEREPGDDYPY